MIPATAQKTDPAFRESHQFEKYFDDCGVKGTIIIEDRATGLLITNNIKLTNQKSLPASTFKILNLLIALETHAIADENEIIPWPGQTDTTLYGYRPDIYKDMTVKEAFIVSAGWVFNELANRIGKSTYQTYLTKCNYGNGNLTQSGDDFWNYGAFGVSPLEQLNLIKKLYDNQLPFSEKNMEIVKAVMKSETTSDYDIHAKTGWTRDSGINTGWWLGYLDSKKGPCFFVIRLLQDRKYNRKDFGTCRKTIVKSIVKDLNII